jgi:hypothetical protein
VAVIVAVAVTVATRLSLLSSQIIVRKRRDSYCRTSIREIGVSSCQSQIVVCFCSVEPLKSKANS